MPKNECQQDIRSLQSQSNHYKLEEQFRKAKRLAENADNMERKKARVNPDDVKTLSDYIEGYPEDLEDKKDLQKALQNIAKFSKKPASDVVQTPASVLPKSIFNCEYCNKEYKTKESVDKHVLTCKAASQAKQEARDIDKKKEDFAQKIELAQKMMPELKNMFDEFRDEQNTDIDDSDIQKAFINKIIEEEAYGQQLKEIIEKKSSVREQGYGKEVV